MRTQVMDLVETAGLQQAHGCAAALPAIAIQQDRGFLVQQPECLLDDWQWYILRTGQSTAFVLVWLPHINKLRTLVNQGTRIFI